MRAFWEAVLLKIKGILRIPTELSCFADTRCHLHAGNSPILGKVPFSCWQRAQRALGSGNGIHLGTSHGISSSCSREMWEWGKEMVQACSLRGIKRGLGTLWKNIFLVELESAEVVLSIRSTCLSAPPSFIVHLPPKPSSEKETLLHASRLH